MQEHQVRVVEEKQDLDSKLERLQLFVASTKFDCVPLAEQARLKRQFSIMKEYSKVLEERIEAF